MTPAPASARRNRRSPASGRLSLAAVVAALAPCLAGHALAQVSLSAAVETDDRFRGVSLSGEQPTASVSVAFDHASGAYGGLTGLAVATRHDGLQTLGWVAYLGYAGRLGGDASWDIGVTNSEDDVYVERRTGRNYTEVYAGLSRGDLSAHVYYSPRYLTGVSTLYLDVDGALRPARNWRLYGHAGALAAIDAAGRPFADRTRLDLTLGVAREFRHAELHLAWTTTNRDAYYPAGLRQGRDALVFGAAYYF